MNICCNHESFNSFLNADYIYIYIYICKNGFKSVTRSSTTKLLDFTNLIRGLKFTESENLRFYFKNINWGSNIQTKSENLGFNFISEFKQNCHSLHAASKVVETNAIDSLQTGILQKRLISDSRSTSNLNNI